MRVCINELSERTLEALGTKGAPVKLELFGTCNFTEREETVTSVFQLHGLDSVILFTCIQFDFHVATLLIE